MAGARGVSRESKARTTPRSKKAPAPALVDPQVAEVLAELTSASFRLARQAVEQGQAEEVRKWFKFFDELRKRPPADAESGAAAAVAAREEQQRLVDILEPGDPE